jgi:hypothetical protein
MLRIDVDRSEPGRAYAIPPDNPFVGNREGWLEEIWASGFRNPWRYSFDPATGMLWAGENGENSWEEIDIIERGKNYGWRVMEGNECFLEECDPSQFAPPYFVYGGTAQRRSVIGGHVYRGEANPELAGKYVYADYIRGLIWALEATATGPPRNEELQSGQYGISSLGVDEQNELYFCRLEEGRIDHFRPTRTPVKPVSLSNLKGRYR